MKTIKVTRGLQSIEMDVLKFSAMCHKSGVQQKRINEILNNDKKVIDITRII